MGNHKMGAISAVMEVRQTSLTKYLRTLIDLDILERQVPITEENPEKCKRGLYRIKDNFIDFWFKFVYPQRSLIEIGQMGQAVQKIREGFISRHVSGVYEDVCRQRLWQFAAEGALPCSFNKAGRWWDNRLEIDIVALDSSGKDIIFGECKYVSEPMDIDVYYRLLEKKKAVLWNQAARHEYFVFFSINGYTGRMNDLAAEKENIFLFQ